jgi:hypothetical protein
MQFLEECGRRSPLLQGIGADGERREASVRVDGVQPALSAPLQQKNRTAEELRKSISQSAISEKMPGALYTRPSRFSWNMISLHANSRLIGKAIALRAGLHGDQHPGPVSLAPPATLRSVKQI